jgi:predicted metalloprotease with PDZ domain
MPYPSSTLARTALVLALTAANPATRAQPVPIDTPYPGTIALQVDATDLDRRIFRVRETLPVAPGPLRLYYPRWLPGDHAPAGRITEFGGLKISAAGVPVAWRRDPLDVYAFTLEVPAGVATLDLEFQQLSTLDADSGGRVVVTPEILNVQWNAVLLYPAGHFDSRITVRPSLRLPAGWGFGSALEAATRDGASVVFKPVSVETLIDSPVFAGKHFARVDLDPDAAKNGRAPTFLNLVADSPGDLAITPAQLAVHRALVTQADRLFGARHYAHYDFLLAISDQLGWIGLEHHQSSENSVEPGYFADWDKSSVGRDLLAHEFTHSWNGKYRRPADLWTPNTNVPMQNSLLWMYEGQTQFWGYVLAARSGLVPKNDMLDTLADTAAWIDGRSGRAWRNLQDTTNQDVMGARHEGRDWRDWQRGSGDFYEEMVLVWLEADMLIRDASGGQRSLDDFARAFFGPQPGRSDADTAPLTYSFDAVVAALNRLQPYDWARFLRERLDTHAPGAPLNGLARAGWRLAWSEEPNSFNKGFAAQRKYEDFSYSVGFDIGKDNRLTGVRWGSPAFDAGLSNAVQLIAVDGLAYKAERLKGAISAAKTSKAPIQLLVKDGDHYKTVSVAYTGGLRYPKLERIDGTEDRLTPLLSARP